VLPGQFAERPVFITLDDHSGSGTVIRSPVLSGGSTIHGGRFGRQLREFGRQPWDGPPTVAKAEMSVMITANSGEAGCNGAAMRAP